MRPGFTVNGTLLQRNITTENRLSYYARFPADVVLGPALFSACAVTVWGLAADMGFTGSFAWRQGPLSNWMVWFVLAFALTLAAVKFHQGAELLAVQLKQPAGQTQNPLEKEFMKKAA